ncbi:hypothetical protein TVAG_110650 [Trichomonas vaginalis G3]|uniref:Uncharacterized protein n=1 Tax=Trichomonas vaginalis (strain ATCC PRA-98 / G3) TaxID=412133 RepID=A2DGR6_TRIV3|nr:hypothetical protein TVAGG3_0997380 [Trichomonas vaginalis G3]EAY20453.1 hypothetical protein TVAG_110650 [Trichomonas vaginalis G3]KAI5490497.1 hypothetical protein TVAGG3_0997380 [Trichomonas vaginalis G3]|eukprot:XP_001581439.1 hypothetical protein [Trichomonas vaginalis G3]
MYREDVNRDHLWAGRETINSREYNRKRQQAYQEELLQQIAQKNSMKDEPAGGGGYFLARNAPLETTLRPSALRRSYDSSTGSTPVQSSSGSSSLQPYIKSSFGPSVGSFGIAGPKNLQFTQTLRTQIETATRPGASTEITIPPLSTIPQPVPMSFAAAARFDDAKFEFMPSQTNTWKSTFGTYSRIASVSMLGVSNVRSQLKNSTIESTIQMNAKPLRVSQIETPVTGFSMRNSLGSTTTTWNTGTF